MADRPTDDDAIANARHVEEQEHRRARRLHQLTSHDAPFPVILKLAHSLRAQLRRPLTDEDLKIEAGRLRLASTPALIRRAVHLANR